MKTVIPTLQKTSTLFFVLLLSIFLCTAVQATFLDVNKSSYKTQATLASMNVELYAFNGSNWTKELSKPVGTSLDFRLNLTGANGQYLTVTVILPEMLSFTGNASPEPDDISSNEYGGQNLYWIYQNGGGSRTFYFQTNITRNETSYCYGTALLLPDQSSTDQVNVTGTSTPLSCPGGPYVGKVNETIIFDGSNSTDSDEDGNKIVRYDWKFFTDDHWRNDLGAHPTYVYDEVGNYTVMLRVHDDENFTAINSTYATIFAEKLYVEASAPEEMYEDKPIQFNGFAQGGVQPYIWKWEFGDGLISTEQNPSHIYSDPGLYTAVLTVFDQSGQNATDTVNVIIKEADTIPPVVSIIQPKNGIYLGNLRILPFFSSIVFGSIDIIIESSDSDSGIDYVVLYIDGVLKKNFSSSDEYRYSWTDRSFKTHEIYVESFDVYGNMESDIINVLKFL